VAQCLLLWVDKPHSHAYFRVVDMMKVR